jgi:K319L-like, PKD domain/PKD domain
VPQARGRRYWRGLVGALVVASALVVPGRAVASMVPVTVTIDSVTSVSAFDVPTPGDPGGIPDFFSRINIANGTWFQSGFIANTAAITPGWSFTKNVSRTTTGGFTPIRIEILDFNGSIISPDLIDVDPWACFDLFFGCSTAVINRPPTDASGLDLTLDVRSGAFTTVGTAGADATGTAGSSTCVTGASGAPIPELATVCFTITIGSTEPENLLVTKRTDGNDGLCSLADCSLREAIGAADTGDTVVVPDLGGAYDLTYSDWDPLACQLAQEHCEPGHLKIQKTGMITIRGPDTGATIRQTVPGVRVFDVYAGAGVAMSNLTLTGGEAGDNSTALPSHIHGGAIHNHGTIKLVNVTITGNHATSTTNFSVGGGGAIYNAPNAHAELTNVTIVGNNASVRAGGIAGTPVTLHNTLVADNTGPDGNCQSSGSPVEADGGGDLQFPGTSCGATIATASKSPVTGPLDGVYELPPGSEAIDRGVGTSAPACPATDEFGATRPIDGNGDGVATCDVGAVEYDPTGVGVVHQPLSSGQPGPVTLTFDNVLTAGITTLVTSSTGLAPPHGFRAGTPTLYYSLSTTALYTGGIKVCIDYTGRAFANEPRLRLFHEDAGVWKDETVSLDTAANVICARVTSLSPFAIFGENLPPTASITAPPGGYTVTEGSGLVLQGSGTDPDGDPLTYSWTPATGLSSASVATPTFTQRDEGTRTFTLVVDDGELSSAPASVLVTVVNAPPVVLVTAPTSGAFARAPATVGVTATFTDAGLDDVHTCSVAWDDGSASEPGALPEVPGSGTCTRSHTFAAAGVYTVNVTVADGDGGVATASTLVVVFDPAAGYASGGGAIDSPAGAYRAKPGATGRAGFAFVVRYEQDANVPTGNAGFMFGPAGASFEIKSFDWLVVTRAGAQFKGVGTLNGAGGFAFLVTAVDSTADRFRIKIWNRGTGAIVYDNVLDAAATDDLDTARPQAISSGSITVRLGR